MFVLQKEDLHIGKNVTVIGKVSRKDASILYIQTGKAEIPVKFKDILNYTNDIVVVTGIVDGEGCIDEDIVDTIDGELDMNLYGEFVEISRGFHSVF